MARWPIPPARSRWRSSAHSPTSAWRRLPEAEVRELIGRGIASLVERALQRRGASADVASAIDALRGRVRADRRHRGDALSDRRRSARAARRRGLPLGVVTNKPRAFTLRLLDRLAVAHRFAVVVAGDDGWPRKPAADMLVAACAQHGEPPEETLMLGDSANDVIAARAAGCPAWCVPYGYNEGRPVESLGCDRIVADVGAAAGLVLAAG